MANIGKEMNNNEMNDTVSILDYLKGLFLDESQNIDFMNSRFLLCQAMKGFAPLCESKTKTLVPIFFRFIK